jgi:hypothetical protein
MAAGNLVDQWANHLARAAPFSPEIHQHGDIRLQNLGLELVVTHMHYLVAHVVAPGKGKGLADPLMRDRERHWMR